jgi:hypothetical protein
VAHQILEDGVFLGSQLDSLAGPADFPGFPVQLEIADPQHGRPDLLGAPAECLHPGQQLLEGKWLGDVVVSARPERLHLEVDGILGRQHEDRRGVSPIAEGPQHLQAIHFRQPQIQDDQIVSATGGQAEPLHAVFYQVGVVALLLQTPLDVLPDGTVVLDHQNFHAYTGRKTRKMDPRPGWLSTSIRPRWSSTMP